MPTKPTKVLKGQMMNQVIAIEHDLLVHLYFCFVVIKL